MLENAKTLKDNSYEIECIGSMDDAFSYDSIINTELEAEALRRHIGYAVSPNDDLTEVEMEQKKRMRKRNSGSMNTITVLPLLRSSMQKCASCSTFPELICPSNKEIWMNWMLSGNSNIADGTPTCAPRAIAIQMREMIWQNYTTCFFRLMN